MASERSDHAPLHEVEEVNLAVHAAGYGRVKVGDVAHAGHSAGVQRHGVVSVELGGLASVLKAYIVGVNRFECAHLHCFVDFMFGLFGQVCHGKRMPSRGFLRRYHVAGLHRPHGTDTPAPVTKRPIQH